MNTSHLRRNDYDVKPFPLDAAQEMVRLEHYSHGGSNTRTFCHGLFPAGCDMVNECKGVAWWIPPTKAAAKANWSGDWRKVLVLTRLVIVPGMPTNAASFLLGRSIRMIARTRQWECLLTYADEAEGHTGAIYRATNAEYLGMTAPERRYVKNGRMIARKAGGYTRTHAEMIELGAEIAVVSRKHRFRWVLQAGTPSVQEAP